MKTDLKRVNWQMGQMLLPHHLFAQEQALLAHNTHLFQHSGLPNYGIIKMRWDEDFFYQGIISISELILLLPSGHLIDIPGNATPSSFDLNSAGKTKLSLYLHLIDEKKEREEEVTLHDETAKISFALDSTLLSPQKNADLSRAVFKLAQFEKTQESVWHLSESFIPPLLTTSPQPFLMPIFANIERVIKSVKLKIKKEIEGADFFASHNVEWRFCLLELSHLERFCENCMNNQVIPHPYYLYDRICSVLDCARSEENKIPIYQHEELAEVFQNLLHQMEYIFISEQKDFSYVEFERNESLYTITSLPPSLAKAREVYLIIQKPDQETHFSANSLKLTSRQRKEFIEHFFVSGITLSPINKPAFLNSRFAEEVEAFSIDQKEEWRKALAEGNLVLSHHELTRDFNVFLYWRNVDGAS